MKRQYKLVCADKLTEPGHIIKAYKDITKAHTVTAKQSTLLRVLSHCTMLKFTQFVLLLLQSRRSPAFTIHSLTNDTWYYLLPVTFNVEKFIPAVT